MEQPHSEKGTYDLEGVISRKLLPEYADNPSVAQASSTTKVGTRKITNKRGDKALIVSEGGEVLAPAGFYETIEVDQTQFVKLYLGGVKMFNELSASGSKVFELVYKVMLKNPNTDRISLHSKVTKMAKTTFERGLTELLSKEVLYKSLYPAQYYINVNYLFNGNRLAFIKEYRLKASNGQEENFQGKLF